MNPMLKARRDEIRKHLIQRLGKRYDDSLRAGQRDSDTAQAIWLIVFAFEGLLEAK